MDSTKAKKLEKKSSMEMGVQKALDDIFDNFFKNPEAPWREDLGNALRDAKLTTKQKEIILNHSTSLSMSTSLQNGNIAAILVHSVRDTFQRATRGFIKTTSYTPVIQPIKSEDARKIQKVMNDIIHNFKLFLGENIPDSAKKLFNTYEEIIKELDNLIDEKEKDLDLSGFDHVKKIESWPQATQGLD